MATRKTKKKREIPKQIYVSFGSYGDIFVFKTAKEAFEENMNIVYLYDFNRKQQVVVKLEDVKGA